MAHFKADYNQIRNWHIYKITNPNDKIYIGLTSDITRRRNDYAKVKCKSQSILFKSLTKYGFEAHKFDIIDNFTSDTNFAYGKEMFWIRTFMSNCSKWPEMKGLNAVEGGRGSIGYKVTEETKQKLRDANLGKKYSAETKEKLSKQRQGKKIKSGWTDDKRKKMSETKLKSGYRHSDEIKKKISEAGKGNKYNVGRKQPPDQVAKRSAKLIGHKFNVGRKQSDETKIKRNAKLTGLKRTAETRLKISQAKQNQLGKCILQYSLDGSFIKEHISLRRASRDIPISRRSLKEILDGVTINPKSFIFKYK